MSIQEQLFNKTQILNILTTLLIKHGKYMTMEEYGNMCSGLCVFSEITYLSIKYLKV